MNFTEINAAIEHIDAHAEEMHDSVVRLDNSDPMLPGTPGFKTIWIAARPVLELVSKFLFFKPKWQKIIQVLITALDAVDKSELLFVNPSTEPVSVSGVTLAPPEQVTVTQPGEAETEVPESKTHSNHDNGLSAGE